ncbi:MAG: exodeoxyribonuclease V subunit gamma, partial [Synechococcaceae cyanobacterium]|nr:exodeoxyribonuclease V subunit gamma [Synechococcaceae cyanobacterium]
MLTVFRSNRAELLARLLAAQLRLSPPDPLTRVEVVVNTWPTSRWLGEQLAIHLGGIAAHLRFPFPATHLRRLVDGLLGEEEAPAVDPWRADRLVWPVLELLPAVAAGAEGEPLRRWLGERQLGRRLDAACWQLGRAIADAFDDYALYRPEVLAAWERGRPLDGAGAPLPAAQHWQPVLYRRLRQRLGREPFGLRVERLIARLRSGEPPADLPQQPLRLFGLSSLAPVQVRLLQALSAWIPVDLYLLTPCRDLWQRCVDRRRALRDALALALPLDDAWLVEAPGLEARFGRLGAEFQQLLEGTGEAQLGREEERDLFLAPASLQRRRDPGRTPPLLAQLQEQLADPAAAAPLALDPGDRSLEFHPCPGRLRQVQIVRDRVLQLLAADPTLEPRDVLVMTPRVDHYAPLLASVFGDTAATGVELPWRLTDRSQQSEAGIGRTLITLLRMAAERFTASGLESLLDCPPLQRRFALEPEATGRLVALLQEAGLRWGLDADERGGDAAHGLGWVIDRLLLGLALPETPGLAPGGTAPLAAPSSLETTGRWLHLLLRLRHWLAELRLPCGVEAWAERLRELLADLFGDGGDAAWELPPLQAAIDGWRQAAGDFPALLDAAVVAEGLDEGLAVDSGRFGHRSGALTISALEPMRAIPHRVVVLMGLDAGAFPRRRPRPGFHLMEGRRRLGDPDPADQDRYALLEALLSARDHLLITWSCRD